MKQSAPAAKAKNDTEELLNFELDDESSLDLDLLGEDEEVIDLVDLVEKGDGEPLASEKLDAAGEEEIDLDSFDLELESPEPSKKPSATEEPQAKEELDLSDLTLELGNVEAPQRKEPETPEQGDAIQADLENLFADNEETVLLKRKGAEEKRASDEAEITEADLDGLLEEGFEEEALESAVKAEESTPPEEELSEMQGALKMEEPLETTEAIDLRETRPGEAKIPEPAVKQEILETPPIVSEPVVQEAGGLSEEKLEMIITRVVEDVIERVARKTMTDVAERLITEAIDALKRSMELSESR
jgi:hypothetical protein